jgi:hypothetical protein
MLDVNGTLSSYRFGTTNAIVKLDPHVRVATLFGGEKPDVRLHT